MSFRLAMPVVVAGVMAATASADDARRDRDRLEGKWEIVTVAADGMQLSAKQAQMKSFTFTGDNGVFLAVNPGDREVSFEVRFKLDPSKKPRAIDFIYSDGPFKGQTLKGIYDLDGDSLKLAFPEKPEGKRPELFESKKGSKLYVLTLKREEAKRNARSDRDKLQGTWSVTSWEENAKQAPAKFLEGYTFTFTGDKVTIRTMLNSGKPAYKLAPDKDPKEIDFDWGGPGLALGVYRLEGDKLKLALGVPRGARPTSFTTKVNDGFQVLELRRTKADNDKK